MAKKSTRKIPSMVISADGCDINPNILCDNEVFSWAVFKETIEGIKDAVDNKSKTAVLFELEKSEFYIEIDKSDWKQALQSCIDKFSSIEDFETCIQIKEIISKIK